MFKLRRSFYRSTILQNKGGMGNIRLKQEPRSSKKNISDLNKSNSGKKSVLSDISKEELDKRRIPVYSYLM